MAVKLLLHLGSSKTGSTSVQRWCAANRVDLKSSGVLFPEVGFITQKENPEKVAGHVHFRWPREKKKFLLKRLQEEMETVQDLKAVLVSSESFFLVGNPRQITGGFEDFDTRALIIFRNQIDWANAQYIEYVTGGSSRKETRPFEAWLRDRGTTLNLNYSAFASRWKRLLGATNVELVPYQPNNNVLPNSIDTVLGWIERSLGSRSPLQHRGLNSNSHRLPLEVVEAFRFANTWPFPSLHSYQRFSRIAHERLRAEGIVSKFAEPAWFISQEDEAYLRKRMRFWNRRVPGLGEPTRNSRLSYSPSSESVDRVKSILMGIYRQTIDDFR